MGDELIGRVVGGAYRIEKLLGEGGMGAVYRAVDVNLDRPVALKVIKADLAGNADFVARFKREAKAAARFKHPNSVDIYAYSEDQGLLFMALELVTGSELQKLLRTESPFSIERAVGIVLQILSALELAHSLGIVHRDLKPQNIMVGTENGKDHVKVLDLGIAKLKELDGADETFRTRSGLILGTPAYMSPEQACAEPVDARSDLYSTGVILFQLLTGALPFSFPSAALVLSAQIRKPPPSPRSLRADIPEALERVVLRALEKKPEDRFQDARRFAEALAVPVTPAPARKPSGAIDGKYEILEKVSSDALGTVYRARHVALDEPVSLRVFSAPLSAPGPKRERFLEEARAVVEVVHPNVLFVRDAGLARDALYLATDVSTGRALARADEVSESRAYEIARQILLGLEAIHAAGLVHGNVTAETVLLEGDGVRLAELGSGALVAPHPGPRQDLDAVGHILADLLGPEPTASGGAILGKIRAARTAGEVVAAIEAASVSSAATGFLTRAEVPPAEEAIFVSSADWKKSEKGAETIAESHVEAPRLVLVANWGSNDVSAFVVDPLTGGLASAGPPVAAGNRPVSIAVSPSGHHAFVANDASNDVSVFAVSSKGVLAAAGSVKVKDGPIALAAHPAGRYVYVAGSRSNDVTVHRLAPATGALTRVGSPVATGTNPRYVAIDPFGKLLYVANYRSNDVWVFRIGEEGALTLAAKVATAKGPRHIAIDPSGVRAYVLTSGSNEVHVFAILENGSLTPMGAPVATGLGPRSMALDPKRRFAFVANYEAQDVSSYKILGASLRSTGPPVKAGRGPLGVAVEPLGQFAYVASYESKDVCVFRIDPATGVLRKASPPEATGVNPYSIVAFKREA